MPLLRYTSRVGDVVWFDIVKDVVLVGRGIDCDVMLDDVMTSRRHFEVRKLQNGYSLVDLSSKNGTFVNGLPVSAWNLRDGDIIAIGSTTLVFKMSR